MLKRYLFITLFLSASTACSAATSHFCNGTNRYIKAGDSLLYVIQSCGEPSAKQTKKITQNQTRKVKQWIYNYKPNQLSVTDQRNYKGMLIVDLVNNKVVAIHVHHQAVQSTDFCGQYFRPIRVGDTNQEVWQICTSPTDIQTVEKVVASKAVEQTTLTYQRANYLPAISMVFDDGKLVSID